MRVSVLLRPLAASSLLFVAACGGSGPANDAGNLPDAQNETLGNGGEALPEEGAGEETALVALPPTPADAPAAETAPLAQAAEIAEEIGSGAGVERVPYEGGWAWRRDGRIIRTASRDGRRVSYFRPGESTPFLVQQGEETFAYSGGRPQRTFDRRGRPGAVTPQRQAEARRVVEDSRRDRDRAEQAPRRPENDSAGPSRGVDDPRRGGGDRDRTGPGRQPDRPRAPRAGQDDRTADRDRDRRGRDDDRGNRQ